MAEQAYHCDEKNLYLVNGVYYFRYQVNHVVKRFSLRTRDLKQANSIASELKKRLMLTGSIGDFDKKELVPSIRAKKAKPLSLADAIEIADKLHEGAERRSKGRGFLVDEMINKLDILRLLNKSDGTCAVSGISFDVKGFKKKERTPFQPSLDRIDSKKGYVKGNVRIVCLIANYAMNTFGQKAMMDLVEAIASGEDPTIKNLSDEITMTVVGARGGT
jgi:hypothetical protein